MTVTQTAPIARGTLAVGVLLGLLMSVPPARAQTLVDVAQPQVTQVAQNLQLIGSITAERDAALSPRVSGLVQTISVDAGDRVKRGQVLLELDAEPARLALLRAEAAWREGRTQLAEARRLRDEAQTLSERGDVPKSQYRTLVAGAKLAEAALARLDAERREQAEQVERHRLPAPFDGVIRRRLTDPGEWVQTGTPVLELVATDALRIDVRAPQRYLSMIGDDTTVKVRLDAAPDRELDGRVVARVPVSDPASRTFLVRVALDASDSGAAPGLSARLDFELARDSAALMVPRDAVKRYPDGTTTVWVIEGGEAAQTAREVPVVLAGGSGPRATVLDGLAVGQQVVVRGNEGLSEGQPVRARTGD